MSAEYLEQEPKRAEIEAMAGTTLLEFGTSWCGWCRRAQPLIAQALGEHPQIRHIKISDASGKRLGRSFGVKLWPTLVFLRDGKELARVVRPSDTDEIRRAFAAVIEKR